MSVSKISRRYAKSLIGLSVENNVLNDVYSDITAFIEACESNADLVIMLKSPIIKSDTKIKILRNIYENSFNKLTLAFFDIVIRKRRESLLREISLAFKALYNEQNSILIAHFDTATQMSDEIIASVKAILTKETGKTIVIETSVDPSLIAGFVLQVGDKQIDTSISRKIRELRKEFENNEYIQKY